MITIGRRGPGSEPTAAEIMSTPGIACRGDCLFEEVAELLADREISGLPVVNDDGKVIGIISERDLAHALGSPLVRLAVRRPARTGPFLRATRAVQQYARSAADIMTTPAITAGPETSLHQLAHTMVRYQINRIPIVRHDRLIGMVTRNDILGAVAGLDRKTVDLASEPIVVGSGIVGTSWIKADAT
jgi:CBS domain-containing protein